jgi:hypothetical protein
MEVGMKPQLSKCHCKYATCFDYIGLVRHEGEVRIHVQCPNCGVGGLLNKAETTPEKIKWAKAGEDVPWIGIEQERVEILPGQDQSPVTK